MQTKYLMFGSPLIEEEEIQEEVEEMVRDYMFPLALFSNYIHDVAMLEETTIFFQDS